MINFIRKKIRSKRKKTHNPNLIQKLHKDHKRLVKLFTKLAENPTEKNYNNFVKELELHLLLEDTNLYEGLFHRYTICSVKEDIKLFKDKITEIVPVIEEVGEYIKNKESSNKINELFEIIKSYLLKRIELEENLLFGIYLDFYKCREIKKELLKIIDKPEEESEL